jgi:hypothetical protein
VDPLDCTSSSSKTDRVGVYWSRRATIGSTLEVRRAGTKARGRGDERQERGGDGQHGGLGGGHAKQLVLDESSRAKRTWVYENLLVSESLHRTNPGGSACRHVARGETDNDEQHSCPAERNRIERRDTKEQPGQ